MSLKLRLLAAGLALLALTACQKTTHTVRYEVEGTAARVRVTYRNATGALEERTDVTLPWQYEFSAETLDPLTVRVFNPTEAGTVSCRILIDGEVFQEAESSGRLTTASCSGLLPLDPTPTPAP
jgi:hypothetical protein